MNTPEKTPLEVYETNLRNQQRDVSRALRFIEDHRETLVKLNLRPSIFTSYDGVSYVDFDRLERPDVLRVIKAFPGKWSKSPGWDGGLNYTNDKPVDGCKVRCYNGEPPAGCKIVETVTYNRVPARRERVVTRTVVCK